MGHEVLRAVSAAALLAGCASAAAADVDIVFVSDFDNSHLVQWVRRHPRAGGASLVLEPAYVTATRLSNSGTFLTVYVEVPPALNGNADYPQWSGLKTFGDTPGAIPAIGDCVIVTGFVALFNGASELASATWTIEPASACGASPVVPYVAPSVASVATDVDQVTVGLQPAPNVEPFESVLVRLSSPYVLTTNGGAGTFRIGDDGSGSSGYLSVAPFIYQYNSVAGTQLSSVTGVIDEFDSMTDKLYQLLPRGAADIAP